MLSPVLHLSSLVKGSFFMVTLFLNWIYVISEITEHYCCQIVPYLLHIKNLARINSQLVAGLWSLFFPTYISAWVIALLKLPNDFLSLLSRLVLFWVFYSQWGGGHHYFPAYSIFLLASIHTSKHCYQFQAFYQFPSVHGTWSAQLFWSLLSHKTKVEHVMPVA